MDPNQTQTEPRPEVSPAKKSFGRKLAFYLGLFGVGTGFITFFTDILSLGVSFFMLAADYETNPTEFIILLVLSSVLMSVSLVVFAVSISLSTSSLLVNTYMGVRREKSKTVKGLLIAIIIILIVLASVSVTSRGVFGTTCVLAGCIGFESDVILLLPFFEVITAIVNIVCAFLMCTCGLAAVCLKREGWFNYVLAAIGLLMTPILAFLFAVIQALFILAISLLLCGVALVALMVLFGLLAS